MSGAQAEQDADWMDQAVVMAERGLGTTAPNPSVGAVLVRDGVLIARATTQPGGRPHAETVALVAAGEAAHGATLYATLEPCSHYGKTPPCADALIAAGVARVVIGVEDPDPRVAGRGIAKLRAAGVEAVVGINAQASRKVTLGHILRVTEQRPAVLIKMALMSDLSVPIGGGGRPRFVTGPEARAMGHLHRARSDAILVGSGTVRDDDPELTCRLPGMENRSPRRVVLDGKLEGLSPKSKLARTARSVPVWVMTTNQAPSDKRAALEDLGVRVSVLEASSGRPNLEAVMTLLAVEGVSRLMVEGGRTTWTAFSERQWLDEAIVFVQGSKEPPDNLVTFERLSGLKRAPDMSIVEKGAIGTDSYFRFERD